MSNFFAKHFNLKEDQADIDEIHERIVSGSKITGTNMYILIFAILIACVGLNMDSTAVVIGAMLISPLMSIIISMAYAIAGHDVVWIRKSISSFLFQVLISISASTIYFFLSPINTFSGELAARTNPTILDVIIAFLGGSAAIIANTRKNLISNVIPGAAIATALMPPLCTIGYCIANGKWTSALGSAYLFLINTIFICLSALIGLHLMKITRNKNFLKSAKSRIVLTILLLLAIIPSSYLAWQTITENEIQKHFQSFISTEFQFESTQVVTSNIDQQDKVMYVSLIGNIINEDSIHNIESHLPEYQLDDYQLEIIQTHINTGVTREELQKLLEQNLPSKITADITDSSSEAELLLKVEQEEQKLIADTLEELHILYPQIVSSGFTVMYQNDVDNDTPALVLKVSSLLTAKEEEKVKKWIETRTDKKIELLQILQ